MRTEEKYQEMGFTQLGKGKVQDRHGDIYYPKKARSPQQAIKLFCRECMGMDRRKKNKQENIEMVRDCTDPMCPLYDFRMGKNPFLTGHMTEERKKAASERMKLFHQAVKQSSGENEAAS